VELVSPFRIPCHEGGEMVHRGKVPGLLGMLAALCGGFACSSAPTEPSSVQPTLTVTNPWCDSLGCRPLQLRAFVWAFTVPQPAIGLRAIQEIHAETTCVVFPPSWQLVVSEEDSTGKIVRSDTALWTPDDPIYLTILDLETREWLAATETFVPAEAPGWGLTISPRASQERPPYSARVSPSKRCKPS